MTEQLMILGYLAPMAAVFGLFWNVARRLGHIEAEVSQLRKENRRLESELLALRTLLSMLVDSRTKAG
jgi:hypothetical protein